ncbi:MAG TPA: sialidase family protein, partial [Candidatus Kapabacteria bacterium]|nr:sialidase family protein [Candidatus Kapabacteria bacterium]
GYPCINGDAAGPLMVNSFPSIACDPVSWHERTYLVWCAKGTQPGDTLPHLWYSFSDGVPPSWSAPRAIEGDSTLNAYSRFFPWIATDPKTGNVAVVYYVAHFDSAQPPRLRADLYMMHSTDFGDTWATRRISNASSYPADGRDARANFTLKFFGDYINLAGHDNTWYPAWTDGRNPGDLEIYTAIVQPFAPMPVTQLAAHDTTVDGKPATVLTWQYTPETTFGYPLPKGYQFAVAKDGSQASLQPGELLQFVDTNIQNGNEYEVTVVSGSYRSITDSLENAKNAVAMQAPIVSSVRFLNEPAIAGREDQLLLDCGEACRVTLTFYDELGREVGRAVSDDAVSTHHEIGFSPTRPGAEFFVLKESSSSGTKEITGKLSIIGE